MAELKFEEVVIAKLAQEVVDSLGPEEKSTIITALLKEAMSGYTIKHAITGAIEKIAMEDLTNMLASPEFRQQVSEACGELVKSLMSAVPGVCVNVLMASLSGVDNYGSKRDTAFTRKLLAALSIEGEGD